MLDRVAGLSRSFLVGQELPSFTSFAQHRKFFIKLARPFGDQEDYAKYMRSETGWFETLKNVRDKFLVHQGPSHRKLWLLAGLTRDVELMLLLNPEQNPVQNPERFLVLSVHRLVKEVDRFLRWFCAYGVRSLSQTRSE